MKKLPKEFFVNLIALVMVILVCAAISWFSYSVTKDVLGTGNLKTLKEIPASGCDAESLEEMRLEYVGLLSWLELAEANEGLILSAGWQDTLRQRFEGMERGFALLEENAYKPDLVTGAKFTYLEAKTLILEGVEKRDVTLISAGIITMEEVGLWYE